MEKENFSLLLVRKLYHTYQQEIKNKKAIENLEKNLSHQLEITEKNLELKIPMEDVSLLRKEIALLKEKLLGKSDEYSIDTSVEEELIALRAYIGPLLPLPEKLELLERRSEELANEETKELGYKIDDLIVKTDELQNEHTNLEDHLIDEINQTDNWVSRLSSELEGKISALEGRLSEKAETPSELGKEELYSIAAALREEVKNKVESLRIQTDTKLTGFDRRLSQSVFSNKTDYDSLRVRIASLEATLSSITKENRQLKGQLTELAHPKNESYSPLHYFGAIALFIFIVIVVIAAN